ncbi:hypothetical protein HIM_02274 [Hirsutella minnesotensis 3608]|nr:hypothetical protein HIM_02274 [Hirsutella minnesotensis 3608]
MARPTMLLWLVTLLSVSVAALTQQKALVSVRNNSKQPMYNVSVVHKYSSVYKDNFTWPVVQPGELAAANMTVQYHTGFATTGVDWWVVAWVDEHRTAHVSDPLNFRKIVDYLEKRAPRALSVTTLTLAGLISVSTAPVSAIVAAVAVAIATQEFTDVLFNSESTDGFKQHMLTADDAGALTEIIIHDQDAITFKSNSGESETVSRALTAPDQPAQPARPEVDMSAEDKKLADAALRVQELQKSAPGSKALDDADAAMWKQTEDWLNSFKARSGPQRQPKPRSRVMR